MFSGKSEELIRRLRRATIARRKVQVFKPAMDNRYSETEIVSHADSRMRSESVESAAEILRRVDPRTQLADSGKQVIIAGLDTDFMGRPFAPMPDLLAVSESITKMLAICVQCGAPAKHTQRLVGSEDLIQVGAADAYEARCRRCFEPGLPSHENLALFPNLLFGRSSPPELKHNG